MKHSIEIPITIHTPKISRKKTNSIFYAGKNIASIKLCGIEYVLTTAGTYKFSLNPDSKIHDFSIPPKRVLPYLDDERIQGIDLVGLILNWGWFGINVWVKGTCMDYPTDSYSEYDEALGGFKEFVTTHHNTRLLSK